MFRNKKLVQISLFLFSLILLAFSGNPPNGASGAPGDVACTNCHSGGAQEIEFNVLGFPQSEIAANTVYPITIEVIQNAPDMDANDRAGFQMTVIRSSLPSSSSIGTLASTDPNASVSFFNGRQYLVHNNGAKFFNSQDTVRYTGTWTAPATPSVLDVNVFATCVVANGNGTPSGDRVGFYNDLGNTFPVEFLRFEVSKYGNDEALISWVTGSEINSSHFIIERSLDGTKFEEVYQTEAKGTIYSGGSYEWYDKLVDEASIIYYRIKEVAIDGAFMFSSIVTIKPNNRNTDLIRMFPNPVAKNQRITIDHIPQYYQEVKVELLDFNGNKFWEQTDCNVRDRKMVIHPNIELSGMHYLKMEFDDKIKTFPFIVIE